MLTGFFLVFLASCASTQPKPPIPYTSLLYSGYFKLSLPTSSLESAKILSSDGPTILLKNGSSLSGLVITRELESLPADFNLRDYPLYVLGLAEPDTLNPKIRSKFENSQRELFGALQSPRLAQSSGKGYTLHSACDELECVSFLIQDKQDEQILMLSTTGFTIVDLQEAIEGANNANRSRAK